MTIFTIDIDKTKYYIYVSNHESLMDIPAIFTALPVNVYFVAISGIFLILGLINSKLLSPLNKIWIKLGEVLGIIIAPIVMFLVYFIVLTPVSLIVRLFGKDLLGLMFFKKKYSYWIKRKKNLGSMNNQF